jgi:hypothetical protein
VERKKGKKKKKTMATHADVGTPLPGSMCHPQPRRITREELGNESMSSSVSAGV